MGVIENQQMKIPTNYQGLIKMGYEVYFIMEERLDEWIHNVETEAEKDSF
jgi:hypothetical protein